MIHMYDYRAIIEGEWVISTKMWDYELSPDITGFSGTGMQGSTNRRIGPNFQKGDPGIHERLNRSEFLKGENRLNFQKGEPGIYGRLIRSEFSKGETRIHGKVHSGLRHYSISSSRQSILMFIRSFKSLVDDNDLRFDHWLMTSTLGWWQRP